jgi:hypothetical protein
MRRKLTEKATFKNLCDLLAENDPKLKDIPIGERHDFLGFFEEVALIVNSGFMRKEVAFYMFGYYVIQCSKSNYFWDKINRDSIYWSLFNDFAEQMQNEEDSFEPDRIKYRF